MKRILTLTALLLALLIFACSCGKEPYSELLQDMSVAKDPTIVGFWYDPIQPSKSMDDVWEYRADGTLYLHQIDSEGVIKKSIKGSYKIEGAKLINSLENLATLTYDSYEIISDSLVLSDHGKESAFAKYTKTVYK